MKKETIKAVIFVIIAIVLIVVFRINTPEFYL